MVPKNCLVQAVTEHQARQLVSLGKVQEGSSKHPENYCYEPKVDLGILKGLLIAGYLPTYPNTSKTTEGKCHCRYLCASVETLTKTKQNKKTLKPPVISPTQ
jgi:hypothetical protein